MNLKRVPHSRPISLKGWTFSFGDLDGPIAEGVAEALDTSFNDDYFGVSAWLPNVWYETDGMGGPPVDDPLTIYVEVPLGAEEGNDPTWSFTLADLLEEEVGSGEGFNPNFAARARDRLRELADKIDLALGAPPMGEQK